jgi:hypothetical protein
MKRQVVLTVSESKRLIAKGVAALSEVRRAMEEGMVVVATGTTNAYVLQELWGKKFDLRRYRSGMTTPKEPERHVEPQGEPIPDVVFRKGEVAEEFDRYNAVAHMGRRDVYIKGANALDYEGGWPESMGIDDLHWLASQEDSDGPSLWPITGNIVTEIEALQILTGVDALLYSSGGVAGAEGAVRLLLEGTEEEVEAAIDLVDSIKGEPRYLL